MHTPVDLLRESEFFSVFEDEDLYALSRHAVRLTFDKGERIIEEGRRADRFYVIERGTVELSFLAPVDPVEVDPVVGGAREQVAIHTINRPGVLIGWSAMVEPYIYRAGAEACETSRLLAFEREFVEEYCERRPEFGWRFLKRIMWALGDRLGASRQQLARRRGSADARRVRAVIAERASGLSMNSPLHKVPHYLEARLTVADAFEILERLAKIGSDLEQRLARQLLASLGEARREGAAFRQLQRIYDAVAEAPASDPPEEIRRKCCEEFERLYALTDYRVEGWSNLPEKPGFIVLMNHLANHPDNTLPNRFQLTLDTHFVSAVVLYRRYGQAPVRVVRQAEPDELGHRRYFDRLGYITVSRGRPAGNPEDSVRLVAELRKRFVEDAAAVLQAGVNLVICPEGGSTSTEASPMAFRAGAFRIAEYAQEEPWIVPVAVANFDKQITRTRLAAKIFPPFRLSDAAPHGSGDAALYEFINGLRQRYRAYVAETAMLAAAPEARVA